jgi:hypothetical protein
MSIDISSVIPMINTMDIKVNKKEESEVVKPIEESSNSGNAELQLNQERFTDINVKDNSSGVGDTYSTSGGLVKEATARSNGDNKNIDVMF